MVKCKKCGFELPDEAVFCPNCGTKRKKSHIKLIMGIILSVILLAVAAGVFFYVRGLGGSHKDPYENLVIYSSLTGEFVNLDGESYSDESVDSTYTSRLGETTAYTEWEDDTCNLYCITKDLVPISIAKDVCSVNMSVTGDYIVYTTYDGDNSYETTLYIYNVDKDKSTKIDDCVYPYDIALSPSGKTVAYLKDYEGEEDNTLYIGGISVKAKKVDKDGCYPVAISDNGKNFFYMNTNQKFYYYNGKDTQKLQVDVDSTFWFNESISEVLITKGSRTFYYTPKMDEPEKIANYAMDSYLTGSSSMNLMDYCSEYGVIINKISLKDTLIMDDNTLLWINKDATDTVKVASLSGSDYQLSDDGKSILYLEYGELYRVSHFSDEMNPILIYDDVNISYFKASKDLSKLYLVTGENELYYYKNKNKLEKLSTDISMDYSYLAYNEYNKKIYYIEDNKLYAAGTKSKSSTVQSEDTEYVYQFGNGIMYIKQDDFGSEYFYLKDKEPVKFLSYQE